jgi:hypothetical protein
MAEPKIRDRLVGGWHRNVQFDSPDQLVLSVSEPGADGVMTTQTISWARQRPR